LVSVACAAVVVAGGWTDAAVARINVWRVAGYSFSYEASTRSSRTVCGPEYSYPTGYDVSTEQVQLSMSSLTHTTRLPFVTLPGRQVGAIPYNRPPDGPTTLTYPFGGRTTLHRHVSREYVNCSDGSRVESSCDNPLTIDSGYQAPHLLGAFTLNTRRRRGVVNVRLYGSSFGPEDNTPFECPSAPGGGGSLGPPIATDPFWLRTTVQLRAFARPTTTITLERAAAAPPDAAMRNIPFGTIKVSAKITLRRSVASVRCGPLRRPDRLFVCDTH
jgi:hypothetical protein